MAKASINSFIKDQISDIRKQIGEHEKSLRSLRRRERDIRRAALLLGGKGAAGSPRRKRAAGRRKKAGRKTPIAVRAVRKGRRTNWEATVKSLSSTFTMDQLAGTRGAKGKSRAYLHQIINRWKKAGIIKSAGRATYQKA
ncbi:MAG: hypothetical protein ACE5JS_12465 [Nitrospinota bacterium]